MLCVIGDPVMNLQDNVVMWEESKRGREGVRE